MFQKHHEKSELFKLNDDNDDLTHYGQSLSEIEKFEEPEGSCSEDEETGGQIGGVFVCVSVCLSVSLSVHQHVCLCLCPFVFLSACTYVCPSVHPPVFVRPSVRL